MMDIPTKFNQVTAIMRDYFAIKKQHPEKIGFPIKSWYPIFRDRDDNAGNMKGHYFHQDLRIAQKIFKKNPARHIDIGSRIDGFIAHVASFREIEVFDIRKLDSQTKGIKFKQADLMSIPESMAGNYESVSSLHAIEHFGLGRYGDPIDSEGHLKAISNITKMLKSGGTFYFSVPIGEQRIEFNAHRVFSIRHILELFQKDFELITFDYVDDRGDFHLEMDAKDGINGNFNCVFGCGIFEFRKKLT